MKLGGVTSWVGNEGFDKAKVDTSAPQRRTDANADHWRAGNVRLYNKLQRLIWPSQGIWHSTYVSSCMLRAFVVTENPLQNQVDWQQIFPARVLEHPEEFEWALGRVDTHDNCSALHATWGNCQPKRGRHAVCGDPNDESVPPSEGKWTCPFGIWRQNVRPLSVYIIGNVETMHD